MEDLEYSWDLKVEECLMKDIKPEVDKLTNVCNNETRMRQYYVSELTKLKHENLFKTILRKIRGH